MQHAGLYLMVIEFTKVECDEKIAICGNTGVDNVALM